MQKPNVIVVITDDQGYGDLGCTGNPWMITPNIDAFHDEAIRLTDFHVSPLCTPTRGAIMSGKRPLRNGAWNVCWARSMLNKADLTMADLFRQNGYRTGLFGKWHLGDNYPYRPQDRGFETVIAHKGGGVGTTADFWGNNYFDDTYFHNSTPVAHGGYCTDIWFDEAGRFIRKHADEPFFCFLSTNAPHSPYLVAERYTRPYADNPDIPFPEFCGMIANIDENFGKLRALLHELDIEDNTILIFMTDNGSTGGSICDEEGHVTTGYNAGMRGKKASYYDGGHRVPFFLRWPGGDLLGGRDLGEMALHIDMLPTLIDLCGLKIDNDVTFDGCSLAEYLRGGVSSVEDRREFVQFGYGNSEPPEKWMNAVITRKWRLVHGTELYDITQDPGQHRDVAQDNPGVVQNLRAAHEEWWDEVSPGFSDFCAISLGSEAENPTCLNSMDVMGDVAWNHRHVLAAAKSSGRWNVDVESTGRYRLDLRRWPEELDIPMDELPSQTEADRTTPYPPYDKKAVRIETHPVKARLSIAGLEATKDIEPGSKSVSLELELSAGTTVLEAEFNEASGERWGAYYVIAERL